MGSSSSNASAAAVAIPWTRDVAEDLEDKRLQLVVDLEWLSQSVDGVPVTPRTREGVAALRERIDEMVELTQALFVDHAPLASCLGRSLARLDALGEKLQAVDRAARWLHAHARIR